MKSSSYRKCLLYMYFPLLPISLAKNVKNSAENKLIKYFDLSPPFFCKEFTLSIICITYKDLDMSGNAST